MTAAVLCAAGTPLMSLAPSHQRKRVGVVGYDGVAEISLIGPLQAFASAFVQDADDLPQACYEVTTIGVTGEPFVAESGLIFQTRYSLENAPDLDTIIIPGGQGLRRDAALGRQIAAWVKTRAAQTRRVVSICTGIYGIAPSGLLDDRRVTTHWRYARDASRRFPALQLEENALFLQDGKFYTSAGGTAGIDLSLALVAQDFGGDVALALARDLLVYLRRDGGQEQYSEPLPLQSGTMEGIGELAHWIDRHLHEDLRLDKLARRVSLTKLHFIRQFKATFGVTPGVFIKNRRLNEARRRLLQGENTAQVAVSVGFRSTLYFSQEFKWRFGAAPEEYQSRFRLAPPTARITSDADAKDVSSFESRRATLQGKRWERRSNRRGVPPLPGDDELPGRERLAFASDSEAARSSSRAAA